MPPVAPVGLCRVPSLTGGSIGPQQIQIWSLVLHQYGKRYYRHGSSLSCRQGYDGPPDSPCHHHYGIVIKGRSFQHAPACSYPWYSGYRCYFHYHVRQLWSQQSGCGNGRYVRTHLLTIVGGHSGCRSQYIFRCHIWSWFLGWAQYILVEHTFPLRDLRIRTAFGNHWTYTLLRFWGDSIPTYCSNPGSLVWWRSGSISIESTPITTLYLRKLPRSRRPPRLW